MNDNPPNHPIDKSMLPKTVPFTQTWHTKPYPSISPNRPELSAKGRNIVVTGGGAGIGNAIAIGFAQAGARSVTILGRHVERLMSGVATVKAAVSEGGETKIFHEPVDLLSREATNKAFQAIASRIPGGKIDVLVSNAGAVPIISSIADSTDEQFLVAFQGQVMTAVHAIQAFLPLAGPNPIILSTNTCIAHWPAINKLGLYSFSRAALLRITDHLQHENPHLHVVSVQPGWVATAGNGYDPNAPDDGMLFPFLPPYEQPVALNHLTS